jgi:hypothetical protein
MWPTNVLLLIGATGVLVRRAGGAPGPNDGRTDVKSALRGVAGGRKCSKFISNQNVLKSKCKVRNAIAIVDCDCRLSIVLSIAIDIDRQQATRIHKTKRARTLTDHFECDVFSTVRGVRLTASL